VQTGDADDLVVRIRDALPALQPAERRVAQATLADPTGTAQLSITALAALASTSETTVMRFCRTMGLRSYPQLRLALAGAAAREKALRQDRFTDRGDIDVDDSLAEVVDKIVFSEMLALEDTRSNLDLAALALAVEAIGTARRVDVVGSGASGFVARDLQQKLHRIGLIAFAWTDVHAALTAAALLGGDDVLVGVSHSGETVDTLEPVQVAAARGACTVALTNFSSSPITGPARIVLTTAARETAFRSGATASRIAQLAVVDALFVGVAQRRFDETSAALERTRRAVRPHRRGR
jgi:DNA-binding MurR/RpiR family transcriptional regulator